MPSSTVADCGVHLVDDLCPLILGVIRFLTVLANFRGQLVGDLCPYMGGDTNWGLIKMVVRYGRTAVTWGNWWQGGRRSRMINDGHKYIVGRVGQGGQSRVLAILGSA